MGKLDMESLANKAALDEITFGEVWETVKDRVEVVYVKDGEFSWGPFETISFVPGVKLDVSSGPISEDVDPDYSFDLKTKIKIRKDHIELTQEDLFGEREDLSVYFFFRPKPQVISLDFLLPGGGK